MAVGAYNTEHNILFLQIYNRIEISFLSDAYPRFPATETWIISIRKYE